MPRRQDDSMKYYKQHAVSDRSEIPKSPKRKTNLPPKSPQQKSRKHLKKQLRALSQSPVVKNALSVETDNNSMFHPPSFTASSSRIEKQQNDNDAIVREPSFVRDSSLKGQVVYHPPIQDSFTDEEEDIQQERYRAALHTSFTPHGVQQFERNMDQRNIIVAQLSSETMNYSTNESLSYATSDLMTSTNTFTSHSSPEKQPRRSYNNMNNMVPFGVSSDASNYLLADELHDQAHDDYFRVKQSFGYCAIGITAIQLLVLMLQLFLCGVAPLDVNYMIGPYPDAFSEWGGKNAYLILVQQQVFRYVTPAFLNVGILHLLLNAYVQLETCAFFEREWGSIRWLSLYLLSEVGCVAVSCVMNPDTLAVGSSGAVMGIFGAKFAQLLTYNNFELVVTKDASIRLEQLSGIMCSLAIVSLLSCVSYIDWSGHVGGFLTGFYGGIVAFSGPIRSALSKTLWIVFGLVLTIAGFALVFYTLYTSVEPDSDLADACEYFRNLYVEGDECECVWG